MGDVLWVVVPSKLHAQYGGDFDLAREYPHDEVRVVPFGLQTRGATETLYVGLQQMSPAELGRRSICLGSSRTSKRWSSRRWRGSSASRRSSRA